MMVKTLRPRQNGRQFADDTFKRILLKQNVRISFKISLKLVLRVQFLIFQHLFQIMAWRRPGDKPLSEAMMVSLLTHICVARPQWAKLQFVEYDRKVPFRWNQIQQDNAQGVSGFVAACPCDVWYRWLTTYLLYVIPGLKIKLWTTVNEFGMAECDFLVLTEHLFLY